ncbi:unnamed protein product [Amoebophrya sp. A120]|nr:unnamed protein product [Amoebophrya sp. A120]|eukprot:GSA120T00017559001.1
MNGPNVSFSETDTTGGVYKGSLFKSLFKDKKTVLEGYPAVKKGLAFPEPCLKFGSSTYTFKTTDVVDKISCKYDDKELTARYKKGTGKWDLFCKVKYCPGFFLFTKYEEKGEPLPYYVCGTDIASGPLSLNLKGNAGTGLLKTSCLYDAKDVLAGLKVAADFKCNMMDLNPALFGYNLGCSYASPAGTTVLAVGSKKKATLNHSVAIDAKTTAVMEVVASLGGDKGAMPLSLGVCHQYDKQHQLRVRTNQAGQVQCCLKKDFSPNLSLLMATCVDVKDSKSMLKTPSFGFKVVTKG